MYQSFTLKLISNLRAGNTVKLKVKEIKRVLSCNYCCVWKGLEGSDTFWSLAFPKIKLILEHEAMRKVHCQIPLDYMFNNVLKHSLTVLV